MKRSGGQICGGSHREGLSRGGVASVGLVLLMLSS